MKSLLFFTVAFLIMGCTKEQVILVANANLDENTELFEGGSAAVIDCNLDLSYQNENGEDLFNLKTPKYIAYEEMKLYYLVGDVKVQISGKGTESYMNLLLFEGNPYTLRIGTNTYEVDTTKTTGISTTYLQLNEETTDTIVSEWVFYRNDSINEDVDGGSYIGNTKVWYNGLEMDLDTINVIVKPVAD